MDARVQVPVEEYLKTSFEGPDPEYVDGEIVERAAPDLTHATVQSRFIEIFYELKKRHPLYALAEPEERFPSTPPYIAIEVLSPGDRFSEVLQKLNEYRAWGVPRIWLVDPQLRRLLVYGATGPGDCRPL